MSGRPSGGGAGGPNLDRRRSPRRTSGHGPARRGAGATAGAAATRSGEGSGAGAGRGGGARGGGGGRSGGGCGGPGLSLGEIELQVQ